MKIFVFSTNKQVYKHLVSELSESKHSVSYFSSIEQLKSAIESEMIVNLIYHLGLRQNDEADFCALQTHYKNKLNTLVLTNSPKPQQGVRLLNLNVRGYANSFLEHEKLITALSIIQQGEIWAGASLIDYMLNKTAKVFEDDIETTMDTTNGIFNLLTAREQQIAQQILLGQQNKIIADELSITERTVKAHLSTIFKKLKVRNRLELTLRLQQADRRSLS